MKAGIVNKLLIVLLAIGLLLYVWTPQLSGMSPFLYSLGLVLTGLAICIWNWRREPDFTDGFLGGAAMVIYGILIALLFLFIL